MNDRPTLVAKVDHLIELRHAGDERFPGELNSGYFWGESGMNETAGVWAINCKHRTKEFLQAIADLEKAMKEEGIHNRVAETAAKMYQKLLDRKV